MRIQIAVFVVLVAVTGCGTGGHAAGGSNPAVSSSANFTAKDAIAKALPQHPDFPDKVGVVHIELRGVGAPGSVVNGTMKTECQSVGPNTYRVIFTKDWQTIVNDVPAISRWEYEVKKDTVRLIKADDHADVIREMK